jgi:hypothetical protein
MEMTFVVICLPDTAGRQFGPKPPEDLNLLHDSISLLHLARLPDADKGAALWQAAGVKHFSARFLATAKE